jgi:Fe-S cluster assembly ATPase SufC
MNTQELPEYIDAASALKPVLANLPPKIVAIGGRPGSGKTSLGRYLAWQFNVSLIETDLFLDDGRGKLVYRSNEIARVIGKRLKKQAPVTVEGVVVLRLLAALGRPADFTIYVSNENAPETSLADEIAAYEAEQTPLQRADFVLDLSRSFKRIEDEATRSLIASLAEQI